MAATKQSDRIRLLVSERYVRPARNAGNTHLSIRVRDVLKDAKAVEDLPRGRTPLICEVLQGKKLLKENGLEIESVDGPPSRQSSTVVVHYRVLPSGQGASAKAIPETVEPPAARATRLAAGIRGLLKKELAEYGGTEGFIRWIRSDEDESV